MGEKNILNRLPVSASNLYAKNMFNFVNNLYDKEKKTFQINSEDEIIEKNGVKIMGETNILNKLPTSASNLYAKNMFNFVINLYDKENKKININLEDEIIEKTLIK